MELQVLEKVKDIISVDKYQFLKEAEEYGLSQSHLIEACRDPKHYHKLEKFLEKNAKLTSTYCAASGASTALGGFTTSIALAGVDLANMAAQLYRFNQKVAITHGYSLSNTHEIDKSNMIFLKALGFETAARTAIMGSVAKAAAENTAKKGVASAPAIRPIMEVTKLLGLKTTKTQAAKMVPFAGAFLGGGLNYMFATSATKNIIKEYKIELSDRRAI